MRDALGFGQATSSGAPRLRRGQADPEQAATIVHDLEAKVDALIGQVTTVDELSAQVSDLTNHVIDIERKLIGLQ